MATRNNPDLLGSILLFGLVGIGIGGFWAYSRSEKRAKALARKMKQQEGALQAASQPSLSPEGQAVAHIRDQHPRGWSGLRWFVAPAPLHRVKGTFSYGWFVGRAGRSPQGRQDNQLWWVAPSGAFRLVQRRSPIFDDMQEYLG